MAARRRSRRAVFRAAAILAAGLAGGGASACKMGKFVATKPPSSPASARGNEAASLVGRTGSPVPASETPVRGGTYVATLGANLTGIDPQSSPGISAVQVANGVMSRLLRPKPAFDVNEANNKELLPDLALTLESSDAMTWTAKLRPDVRFQNVAPVNGHIVEAEDVRVSFQRAIEPGMTSLVGLSMLDGSQIQTPDKNTVVFKLKYPFASFASTLAINRTGSIYPREVSDGAYDPKTILIGSGPFIWESYTPDVAVAFRRNPDYYDKQRPYVDGVKLAIVPNVSQQVAQFTTGQVDELRSISEQDLAMLRKQAPAAETIGNWATDSGLIYARISDPASPFKDVRLRQAMSLALDRDALAKVAWDGTSVPTFFAPQTLGKWALKMEQLPSETAQWYKFDPARAKQLAEAAGASGLEIKYLSPTPYPATGETASFKAMRETTYSMLQELPWRIDLVLLDNIREWMNGGKGARWGNYAPDSAIWAGFDGFTDIDDYVYSWYGSQSPGNIGRVRDDALDAMILKGRSTVDPEERLKQYLDIQKHLAAQMYSVSGNPNGLSYAMIGPRVRNYVNPGGPGPTDLLTSSYANLWLTSSYANLWLKR
jgi:peptide/nickel transport system substrate-binding protein